VIRNKGPHTACGSTAGSLLKGMARAFNPPPPKPLKAPNAPAPARGAFPALKTDWRDSTSIKNFRLSWFTSQKKQPVGVYNPPEWFYDVPEPGPREPTVIDLLPRDPAKLKELIDGPVRELMLRAPLETILEKLKSRQPLMRWLAIQVISRKRLHLEREVIEALGDPHVVVRQAAHEALVRLARGTDFGPPRKATATQIARSVEAWQGWLAIQDVPTLSPRRTGGEGIADPPAKPKKR
jgi:hypothetical protein